MNVLFLNRVYPPADGATGHLLADLAQEFAGRGWNVTVVTARATDASPSSEMVNGVRVEHVGAMAFTRASHWRRALAYLTLYPALLWRALRLPASDVVVTMSDPPLLLVLGPLLKWIKGSRLVHWAQDLYPEVAEELGVLAKAGWLANICRRISTWALRRHHRIIAVGRCMKERLRQRGLQEEAINVLPNWASAVHSVPHAANPFRNEHGLEGRFVVMYSGNLGLAHPFEAILEAAARIQLLRPEVLFLFVGAGQRLQWVKQQVAALRLGNVRFLPVQPADKLAPTLSAADLHLASMLPNLCGLVVPSKVYGVLAAGRPCVFLGPKESEVARIIEAHQCGSVIESIDGGVLSQCIISWVGNGARLQAAGQRGAQVAKDYTLTRAACSFRETIMKPTEPRAGMLGPFG
jgi:colanic acid biosynthesis glycosyl transferase WcaI